MILGIAILALEVPLPIVKDYILYRSLVVRVVLLFFQVLLNILYYQVRIRLPYPPVKLIMYPGHKCGYMVTHRDRMLLSRHYTWRNHEGNKGGSW